MEVRTESYIAATDMTTGEKVVPADAAIAMGAGQGVVFEDVKYTVTTRKGESKEILHGVSGSVKPGELCCIIGPSGAGKTSLMDTLAGRIQKGVAATSIIELDGKKLTRARAGRLIAYVEQEDCVFATETPRECMKFSADLRLPKSTTTEKKIQIVDDIIKRLGLSSCEDTMVGGGRLRGVSGGERKRTSIGVELVTNPTILFLDEPTSGLDSYAALETVKLLKDLANEGCTVLCTIHQPSSEIFNVFDKCLLLSKGQMIYGGARAQIVDYFAEKGHVCPALYNPADFVLFLAQTEEEDAISKLGDDWKAHEAKPSKAAGADIQKDMTMRPEGPEGQKHGFGTQLSMLFKRETRSVIRNKPALIARFATTAVLNLLFGCIFFRAGKLGDTPDEARTHFGALTQVLIGAMFGSAQPVLLAFPLERPVFLREYRTGTYSVLPYFISKTLVELVMSFLTMAIAVLVGYWLIEFQGSVILHIVNAWGLSIVASSVALVLGCAVKDITLAQELTPLIFVPQIMFAGFFIKMSDIPVWLRWAQYLCSLKFAINLGLVVEFAGSAGCDQDRLLSDDAGISATEAGRCNASRTLMESNDVEPDDWWISMVVLIGLFFFFRVMAAMLLAAKAR